MQQSQPSEMPEFVRVKLLQVDFGVQSAARDPYCAVSVKRAVADSGKSIIHMWFILILIYSTVCIQLYSRLYRVYATHFSQFSIGDAIYTLQCLFSCIHLRI